MIDWQVQVDGEFLPNWDQHRDGCWFPDFAHQEYMLPFFDVGANSIDPYGGTEFKSHDLHKLRDTLERSTDAFKKPPKSLTIPEHLGYGSTVFSPDPKIMVPIVKKTLSMIEFALSEGGKHASISFRVYPSVVTRRVSEGRSTGNAAFAVLFARAAKIRAVSKR